MLMFSFKDQCVPKLIYICKSIILGLLVDLLFKIKYKIIRLIEKKTIVAKYVNRTKVTWIFFSPQISTLDKNKNIKLKKIYTFRKI
jgi:hypothetical protein